MSAEEGVRERKLPMETEEEEQVGFRKLLQQVHTSVHIGAKLSGDNASRWKGNLLERSCITKKENPSAEGSRKSNQREQNSVIGIHQTEGKKSQQVVQKAQ